jgi:hypothetical protein
MRAHEVAVAYRPAKADARVQIPLGTCQVDEVWERGNPPASGAGDRRFESGHLDLSGAVSDQLSAISQKDPDSSG